MISTCGSCPDLAYWGASKSSLQRATVWPSALDLQRTDFSAHAEAEDRKLRKELALEVLALKVPFRNLPVVSESSPVAGTIENSAFSENLDAGRPREIQQIRPAATHLLSVDCLYQMNKKNCKGQFEKCVSLLVWCGGQGV